MLTVQILTDSDTVNPDDWCRPLEIVSMSGGHSDLYSFTSMGGSPENNAKWVQVKYILGKPWHGKTVDAIDKGLGKYHYYEFIRGAIPNSHKVTHNKKWTDHSKVYRDKWLEVDDDIPF